MVAGNFKRPGVTNCREKDRPWQRAKEQRQAKGIEQGDGTVHCGRYHTVSVLQRSGNSRGKVRIPRQIIATAEKDATGYKKSIINGGARKNIGDPGPRQGQDQVKTPAAVYCARHAPGNYNHWHLNANGWRKGAK